MRRSLPSPRTAKLWFGAVLVAVLLAGSFWLWRTDVQVLAPVASGPAVQPAAESFSRADGPAVTGTETVDRDQVDVRLAERDEQTLVTVRVVDHDQTPLAGVTVRVAHPGPWGTYRDLRTARTDLAGRVQFVGYARDDLWAEVVAESLPNGHVAASRMHASLKQQSTAVVAIECPVASAMHGLVMRANGLPVVGARVDFRAIDHDSSSAWRRTDHRGRFRFDGAHPGDWRVAVRPEDRRLFVGTSLPAPVTVRLPPAELGQVAFRGRTDGQWILGRVVDAFDRPVPGVLVYAGACADVDPESKVQMAGEGEAFAETDSDGTYRIGPLPRVPHAVQVGERHGSDWATRDRALFTEWPAAFRATPGDGVDYFTRVTIVADVIAWRVRPRLAADFARSEGIDASDVRMKVGWCRLFPDGGGAFTVQAQRRNEDLLLLVRVKEHEWRVRLPEPKGSSQDIELELPPRR